MIGTLLHLLHMFKILFKYRNYEGVSVICSDSVKNKGYLYSRIKNREDELLSMAMLHMLALLHSQKEEKKLLHKRKLLEIVSRLHDFVESNS